MAIVTADSYGIDNTGATDVTAALKSAIDAQPAGTIFQLHADGSYKSDAQKVWANSNGIIVDGQNAALFESIRRPGVPGPLITGPIKTLSITGANMTIRNLRMYGFRKDAYTGNKLITETGSPTIVGTTVELNAANEAVRLPPILLDWMEGPKVYLNTETPFYSRDKDGYVRFEIQASDTTHVANDAVIAIIDDDTSIELASQAFTLTASVATYQLAWLLPANRLGTRLRIVARKATAPANVITIASITAYNEAGYRNYQGDAYQGGEEFSHHFFPIGANCVIEDCYSEGPDGDGYAAGAAGVGTIIRNSTGRCSNRQGLVLQKSTGTLVDGYTGLQIGRAGIDIEPNTSADLVHDATIRNCSLIDCRNYSIASSHSTQVFNLNISNIISTNAGMGPWYGGAVGGTIVNWVHSGTYRSNADRVANGGMDGADAILFWNGLECDGFTTDIGFYLQSKSGSQNMHMRGIRALNPNGLLPPPLLRTDSGHTWTTNAGAWSTSLGKAQLVGGSLSVISTDSGMSDFDMAVDITVGATHQAGLVCRLLDNNNYILFNLNGTGLVYMYKKIAGTYTLLGSAPYTVANYNSSTVRPRIRAVGSVLEFYLGATLEATITEATHQSNTKHGLYANSDLISRWDNLSITAP